MTLEQDIREHVGIYLRYEMDLPTLHAWFADATWNVGQGGDQEATNLTFRIESALAEHTSGYTTEDDFRRELVTLFQEHWVANFERLDHQIERWPIRRARLRLSGVANREHEAAPA
jgi:hypothetical protein